MKNFISIVLFSIFLAMTAVSATLALGKPICSGILVNVQYQSDNLIVLKIKTSQGIELWEVNRSDYSLPRHWRLGKKIVIGDWHGAYRYDVSN